MYRNMKISNDGPFKGWIYNSGFLRSNNGKRAGCAIYNNKACLRNADFQSFLTITGMARRILTSAERYRIRIWEVNHY